MGFQNGNFFREFLYIEVSTFVYNDGKRGEKRLKGLAQNLKEF